MRMLRKEMMRRCSLICAAAASTVSWKYGFVMAEATTRSTWRPKSASRDSNRPKTSRCRTRKRRHSAARSARRSSMSRSIAASQREMIVEIGRPGWRSLATKICGGPQVEDSQGFRAFGQDRQVTVVGKDAIAAPAGELARNAQPCESIHTLGRAGKGDPRPLAHLIERDQRALAKGAEHAKKSTQASQSPSRRTSS